VTSEQDDPQVPPAAFSYRFVRAGGPGGQHVNKVSSAVQLKVHLGRTRLPEPVKARLRKLAGSRLTSADEVTIFADEHRSQRRNRDAALARWEDMLTEARRMPNRRVATRPSRAKQQARVDRKKRLGQTKALRRKPTLD
jgi:ribosome-associated protein